MYLWYNKSGDDFIDLLRDNRDKFNIGVIHGFHGTYYQMIELV